MTRFLAVILAILMAASLLGKSNLPQRFTEHLSNSCFCK
jgi:hypothetical protein